jgi:hypothetical protein
MKFAKTIDIWSFPRELIKHLQRGQWVSAGFGLPGQSNLGRFYGITKGGVIHVAWIGNARGSGDYRGYMAARSRLVGPANRA